MTDGGEDVALLPVEEVVPPRSVLTELARGFLLTRDLDGRRAMRFASTFLREQHSAPEVVRVAAVPEAPPVTFARRLLGRLPYAAVERALVLPSP